MLIFGASRNFLVHQVGHGLPHDGGRNLGHPSTGNATGPAGEPIRTPPTGVPFLRMRSTSLLWNICMATWIWRTISVWSLRGSAMIGLALGAAVGVVGADAGHVVDHSGRLDSHRRPEVLAEVVHDPGTCPGPLGSYNCGSMLGPRP